MRDQPKAAQPVSCRGRSTSSPPWHNVSLPVGDTKTGAKFLIILQGPLLCKLVRPRGRPLPIQIPTENDSCQRHEQSSYQSPLQTENCLAQVPPMGASLLQGHSSKRSPHKGLCRIQSPCPGVSTPTPTVGAGLPSGQLPKHSAPSPPALHPL